MSRGREGTFMVTDANNAAALGDVELLENLTLPQLMAVKDRRGWRPLHHAAYKGQLEVVKLLARTELLEVVDNDKCTPLHRCIQNPACLQAILETQPPASLLNARDKRGCTAFALAAAAGVEMSVDLLIAGGADTTVCDKRKRNALMLAASNGQAVVVDALLRLEGFVIDAKDSQHQTALLLACQQDRGDVVAQLIAAEADVNTRSKSGTTPLWEAAAGGHTGVMEMVLKAGASVTAAITKSPASITALHQASVAGHAGAVKIILDRMEASKARTSFLKLLKRQCGTQRTTALHAAVSKGHLDIVPLLFDAEVKIECMPLRAGSRRATGMTFMRGTTSFSLARGMTSMSMMQVNDGPLLECMDGEGRTPLHTACNEGQIEAAKVLLKKLEESHNLPGTGFHLDDDGNTPLHMAARRGDCDTCDLLLAHLALRSIPKSARGIGAGIRNFQGETAFLEACRRGHLECAKLLHGVMAAGEDTEYLVNEISDGPKGTSPLLEAVRFNHLEIIEYLFETASIKRDVADGEGWGPLHIACFHGGTDVAETLLSNGVQIDGRSGPEDVGATALMRCCCHDHEQTLGALMAKGSRARVVDNQGATALHYAAAFGEVPNNCVETLLSAVGLNADAKDSRGDTPLITAGKQGHSEFCHMLLKKYGADVAAANLDGECVLHIACATGNEELLDVIIDTVDDVQAALNLRDTKGRTPLFLAVKAGAMSMAATLIEMKAKVSIKSNAEAGSQGLLHVAMEQRAANAVQGVDWLNLMALLLQSGAAATDTDAGGKTPYDLAVAARDAVAVQCFEGGFASLPGC